MQSVFRYVLVLSALAVIGCEDASDCMDCGGFGIPYLPATSPENQIENLEIAYRKRDCEGYVKILAPEFIFKFQPQDANDIGAEFWTRDADSASTCSDSAGTCALFRSTDVSDIRIELTYSGRDSSINFPGTPVDTLAIRVSANLQVDQTDGTTWLIAGLQDFYFRLGKAGTGENPNHWLMYEWDDLPVLSMAKAPQEVRAMTWGRLKVLYATCF